MDANTPATQSFPPTQPIPAGEPTPHNPVQQGPVQDSPVSGGTASSHPSPSGSSVKEATPSVSLSTQAVGKPARPTGPHVSTIVLGLVAMAIGGLIIGNQAMGLRVDWSRLGPGAIVGIGLLFVVLGAVGLVRRHDDR